MMNADERLKDVIRIVGLIERALVLRRGINHEVMVCEGEAGINQDQRDSEEQDAHAPSGSIDLLAHCSIPPSKGKPILAQQLRTSHAKICAGSRAVFRDGIPGMSGEMCCC